MKKLKLNVDALRVESFGTAAEMPDRRGTVQANALVTGSYSACYVISDGGGCNFETMGCTFTADADCMESADCP